MEGFQILPPGPDVCQECAVAHVPEQAHNRDSLYFQMRFRSRQGRWPVWKDAIAHCTPEVRALWEEELRKRGVWKEPGPVEVCPMEGNMIGTVTTVPIRHHRRRRKGSRKRDV